MCLSRFRGENRPLWYVHRSLVPPSKNPLQNRQLLMHLDQYSRVIWGGERKGILRNFGPKMLLINFLLHKRRYVVRLSSQSCSSM